MRIVLHIDMDSFFASIEERDKPRLKGKPIVVGADPADGKGRGVVSTANYAARAYGLHSAMPISRAWELSQRAKKSGKPEVVFMAPDFKAYLAASQAIMNYIKTKGDSFESPGADEAYLELQSANGKEQSEKAWERAEKLAKEIQMWVREKQHLTCSIGVGPNKLISKIAVGKHKPDGLTIVKNDEVQVFLDPLSVRELPGVGPKTQQALEAIGIKTIKELRAKTKEFLIEHFGKHGAGMYDQARGSDDSPFEAEREAKSIGEQVTFDKDTLDTATILDAFKQMAANVGKSLKTQEKKFKTISITVRFSDFETLTRSHTLAKATDDKKVLETEALQMLMPFFDKRENPKKKKIRLVGVRAEKLE